MEHAHARAALPQWYADQFGWQEIVDETAVAWNRLTRKSAKTAASLPRITGRPAPSIFSAAATACRFAQRPSDLVSVGTARILRQLPDRTRRQERTSGTAFQSSRIRGHFGRQSVRAGDSRSPSTSAEAQKFGTLTQLWPQLNAGGNLVVRFESVVVAQFEAQHLPIQNPRIRRPMSSRRSAPSAPEGPDPDIGCADARSA
jgi:hypothetical protein